ncbi:MAG: hypothetical protein A2043_05350 [Candidatus Schekmanbacteria bacterium GWA2_38_9]|uniref:Uncharacterized protein n=1 Tax=Candidatus Schekmanbacteria bacterium RIFCSPLOWO2_12_FULL_38_15 TaxID=1817883 RepID=A0A1F7SQF7_9BACT|nr:MAG: hypothetical protein A2043_05350 [Candidatus Schekmanbacteria bacterium GWA2_38_9]OGL50231.1 MAG: hypothetical protein A3H37_00555 [Candidatus Schekmanbacteria bacterium RIFCSPLOWO2_02_FULL_38_14]OGL55458.1 MAG: hypothetical protein A3G31_01445 [Candidatus Schekmanbacteria bacterium RIFCSPLOWO2_12_FULL_38_15]
MKKNLINLLLMILILQIGVFTFNACSPKKENKENVTKQDTNLNIVHFDPSSIKIAGIKVEEVTLKKLSLSHNFPGKIMPDENRVARIGSRIPGRVIEIKVNLGDEVKKGEALATIDSPELGEAESNFLKLEANLRVAEKGYERAKRLFDGKAIGLGEFQRREAEYLNVKAEFQASKEKLYLFGISDKDIERLTSTHIINPQMSIRSPFSGTVVERNLTLGEVIESSSQLFTIIDLSRLWVIADVPEKDISSVEKGLEANIKVSTYPKEEFKGKVTYISDIVDASTRMAKVRIEIDNPPESPHTPLWKRGAEGDFKGGNGGILKPEMFADVQIITKSSPELLVVSEKAIQMEDGKKIIFIAKSNNTFEKREIEVGEEINGFYQVLKGLKAGDSVVTDGAFYLKSELLKAELEEE